jgi:hypothetical protein
MPMGTINGDRDMSIVVRLSTLLILAGISSCGNDDTKQSGEGATSPNTSTTSTSMTLILDAGALPPCESGNNNQLVYVKDTAKFMACGAGTWSIVNIKGESGATGAAGAAGATGSVGATGEKGEAGDNGLSISNIYNLKMSASANLSTRYSNEESYFIKGTLVNFSNGLVQFSGQLLTYTEYDIGGGNLDTDHDFLTTTPFYCGPGFEYCQSYIRTIARAGSDEYRALWLVYFPAQKATKLIYDTNDNGELDSTDETIDTLVATSVEI